MLIAAHHLWSGGRLHAGMAIEWGPHGVEALRPLGPDTPDLKAHLIMPMLTDLQVNGGGGVLFNTTPSLEGLRQIAEAHARLGTGEILPTVITDAPDVLDAAVEAVIAARGEARILGLHIEGPHIAPARRGTHAERYIRPLDERSIAAVERLRSQGITVKVTLAPEMAPGPLFERLVVSGAIVSIGHSEASVDETRAALSAGASCFTHLYNAMPPMTSRDPGLLGVALNADCAAGIICDGVHVDIDMLRLAIRARPGPTFAVSDAMPTVGGPDAFELYGQVIRLQEGRLVNAEGALAGAHTDMRSALSMLAGPVGLPLAEACAMCSDHPRALLGLAPLEIQRGTAEILVLGAGFQKIEALS